MKMKKQSYDIDARAREVAEAASEYILEVGKDADPSLQIFAMICFSLVSRWVDGHPLSSFGSEHDQYNAVIAYYKSKQEKICKDYSIMTPPIFILFESLVIEKSRRWANRNPPKYY